MSLVRTKVPEISSEDETAVGCQADVSTAIGGEESGCCEAQRTELASRQTAARLERRRMVGELVMGEVGPSLRRVSEGVCSGPGPCG